MALTLTVTREDSARDLPLPRYLTDGAAGMDLYAAIDEPLILNPGQRAMVSTGLRIAVPEGYEAQVRPRSGLAKNFGIGCVNSPGTIDSDYRGIVNVLLINLGQDEFTINRGDRIAQMVVSPVLRVEVEERSVLPDTVRGDGGFGHTGV
jgi:dUTP pyrophosphatase